MIFVDRSKYPIPNILLKKNGKAVKETSKAIKHFKSKTQKEPFNYTAYSDPEVKDALIGLFNSKCAYCESEFLHVYSGDIEHFRPKGEITEAIPQKPGYYWLAANWNNLLLSCRNCNQKLSHKIYGKVTKVTMGKMNQFPLASEASRLRSHKDPIGLAKEENDRLLLDPCVDNPEDHLEYDEKSAVIITKSGSRKGAKSIDVFVLQRVPLVLAREKKLIEILAQVQRFKEALRNFNEVVGGPDTTKTFYFEKILLREMEWLKKFTDSKEPYSGMARQVVRKFLQINFGIVF